MMIFDIGLLLWATLYTWCAVLSAT